MKKLLALLLALLMTLPLILACQKGPEKDPTDSAAPASTETTETQDPFDPGVPYTDYKEREFLIMCPSPDDWGIMSYDRQEENAEQVNDAIYHRNRQLESQFNITYRTIGAGNTGTQAQAFQTYAVSGEDVVDLLCVGFYQSGKPLICADYVMPWNDVPYINLDKAWWNKSVSQTLAILGSYYYLVGDVNWFTMPETAVCYFNKVVADNVKTKIDGGNRTMYEIVDDGDWTFETFYDIAKEISADNGDGVWDEHDTYGTIQNRTIGVTGYCYAANYQYVIMTEDQGPVLNINTTKMQSIVDFLYKLCWENNVTYCESFDFTKDSKGIPIFFDNRALFYMDILMHSETFRSYDSDFGIIPYPKYDKEQKEYSTYANQWGLSCALPCTASDVTRTGEILEAMCALSRKLIVPAYYDKTLMGKIKRDDESEPMLEIIFSNVIYDFGRCFSTDLAFNPVSQMVGAKSTNLSSWYKSFRKKMEKNYKELASHVYEKTHDGEEPEWAKVV